MADVRAEDEIFFMYDTTILQKEEDEIKDAILCFYPSVISEQHQWELCGQLVGVLHCVQSLTDSSPNSITLQHSKFSVRQIDKFLIALGGARSETDGSLQRMIDALLSLFNFYHKGFECAEKLCEERGEHFKSHIQQIWDTYLPLYRSMGDSVANTFCSLPYLHIPKHSSCIFLRASHLLQICSRQRGVLGGCLVFKDRILCTELSPELTSRLLVIRPKQKNFPGKTVETGFRLPSGVRILTVYLTSTEVEDLQPSKPPWLQQPGASHCSFQNLYEEEDSYAASSDVMPGTIPASSSALACSVASESSSVDRSLSTEGSDIQDVGSTTKSTETPGKNKVRECETNSEVTHQGAYSDCDELKESHSICDTNIGDDEDVNDNSESDRSSQVSQVVKKDIPDGCCGLKGNTFEDCAAPIEDTVKNMANGSVKSFTDEINSGNSEPPIPRKIDQNCSANGLDTKSTSSNSPKGEKLSDSSPYLCRPSEELSAHRCLQKSHSEERSTDAPCEKLASKSTSCMELSRQLSRDKESQTKFLFRRVKRVVSHNSGAIKNYQMLCNASVEVFSPTSSDVISYPTVHKSIDQVGTRGSMSSQSSNQSQPDIVLPSSGLRVLKIEPRISVDESNTQSNLPDSPNSAKYGVSSEGISPALSSRSLNIAVQNFKASHSSSDDVFRVRNQSSDKITTKLRSRRRSKRSTPSDKIPEFQRAVSFTEKLTVPAGVVLLNQGVKLPMEESAPRSAFTPTSDGKQEKKQLFPHHLYIQGNSELLLMLILQNGQGEEAHTVNALWRSVLPQLGELDMLVKQCSDDSTNQSSEAGLNYLTYDENQQRLGGNTRDPITAIQHHFCGAVTNIHEDFQKMPHLTDIKLRSHNTSIYGHRQGSQETYIQPRGMMRPPVGRPNERDASVVMDTKDLHRLAKHLNHAVL